MDRIFFLKNAEKKFVKSQHANFLIFVQKFNFLFDFLDKLANSGPGKCKILILGIEINNSPEYGL